MMFGGKPNQTAVWNLIGVIESVQSDFDALIIVAQKNGFHTGTNKRKVIR